MTVLLDNVDLPDRKAIVHTPRVVRSPMATVRREIVHSMPGARARRVTVRLRRVALGPIATAPVRNRHLRNASRKTVFLRMIDV